MSYLSKYQIQEKPFTVTIVRLVILSTDGVHAERNVQSGPELLHMTGLLARLPLGLLPGNLDSASLPSLAFLLGDKRLAVPKLCKQLWFMQNTCFPPGSLKFEPVPSRGCLGDWPPSIKTWMLSL